MNAPPVEGHARLSTRARPQRGHHSAGQAPAGAQRRLTGRNFLSAAGRSGARSRPAASTERPLPRPGPDRER
eukprot:8836668-Pyramimonas_sp.AAC.1